MGKFLGGHISPFCSWIVALLTLTIPAFEGLLNDIQFVVTRCTQQILLKENEGSDELKQSIVAAKGSSMGISREKAICVATMHTT